MSLPSTLNKRFFPSYNEIHKTILSQHKKQHDNKVTQLQRKISTLKQTFNLQQEHEQIKNRLLENYNSTNHQYLKTMIDSLNDEQEKLQKQKQSPLWNAKSSTSNYGNSAASNAYSLNYCIDDDLQEDNHYENHLKFKKQVLERDLFEDIHHKNDKKKHHDEEYIFKNLYNPRPSTAFEAGMSTNGKAKAVRPIKRNYVVSQNTREFKENMKQFNQKYKPSRSTKKTVDMRFNKFMTNKNKGADQRQKKEFQTSAVKKCLRKQQNEDQFFEQHEICQKNTKILKDSYGKYLKQLEGTNIIKWRILGGEREKQKEKELVGMSINLSGIPLGLNWSDKNDKLVKER